MKKEIIFNNLEKPNIYSSKAFRLLDRQRNLGSAALRYYASRMVLIEIVGAKACSTLHDMENAFYDKFCLNAWILFGDEGSKNKKTHYFRLVDTNDYLTNQIITFAKTLSNTTGKDPKALLNQVSLKLADISSVDLKNDKEVLKKYRNQFGAHSDDYFPQVPGEQLDYPKLINLAKLTYGLLRIISEVKRIEENDFGINLNIYSLGTFDEVIESLKKEFKKDFVEIAAGLK